MRGLRGQRWSWLGAAVLAACAGPVPQQDTATLAPRQAPGVAAVEQELAAQPVVGTGSGGAAGQTEPSPPLLAAGAGGATQVQDQCSHPYPPPGAVPGEWVPFQPETPPGGELARALLDGVQDVMVGSWRGVVTTPWTSPYVVDITFSQDGHYSARCPELGGCCRAFYYGTDDDTPLKQWRVDDATLSGNVFGELDIAFGYDAEYGLSAWQGELSHIERNASGDGLRFEFGTSDGHGPLRYDLRRVE